MMMHVEKEEMMRPSFDDYSFVEEKGVWDRYWERAS